MNNARMFLVSNLVRLAARAVMLFRVKLQTLQPTLKVDFDSSFGMTSYSV